MGSWKGRPSRKAVKVAGAATVRGAKASDYYLSPFLSGDGPVEAALPSWKGMEGPGLNYSRNLEEVVNVPVGHLFPRKVPP